MGFFDFLRARSARSEGIILALGGGGARGLAHIGVLEVIEDAGVKVAGIAGTSAGAVVGAMWITLGSAAKVEARWREFLAAGLAPSLPDIRLTDHVTSRDNLLLQFARRLRRTALVALALERTGLITHAEFEKALGHLVEDQPIERLPIPFAAVATDFDTGEPVSLRSGSLLFAVAASSAVPGVLLPYTVDGRAVMDGGTVADVPLAQAAELARRPVVCVDVGETWSREMVERITVPRAMLRGSTMTHTALRRLQLADAQLVITPAVGGIHWSEFARLDEALAAGRAAGEKARNRMRALALRKPAEPQSAGAP